MYSTNYENFIKIYEESIFPDQFSTHCTKSLDFKCDDPIYAWHPECSSVFNLQVMFKKTLVSFSIKFNNVLSHKDIPKIYIESHNMNISSHDHPFEWKSDTNTALHPRALTHWL